MEPMRWRQQPSDASASKVPHSYLLEHLATFSGISKHGSLLTPEDGMRQMRQMVVSQGHWVLRVRLVVHPHQLVILDAANGEEMEVIALDMIRQLTAFANAKETFNNVLLFTTTDGTNHKNATEMHMFQCLDESAQVIVDDINGAKTNRAPRESTLSTKPPAEYQQRTQEYEAAAKRTANAVGMVGLFDPIAPSGQLRKNLQQGGSGSSQHIMEGVELLNHCFDDIEQFMNQLQKVATAYKELEDRRQGRSKKDQYIGDGMLTLRVRNPSQQAFTDIFQKFKLSFNLLAKLKQYIHDPNAPELIHFLFNPLGLIVEASSDLRHGPGGLASTVISPLLTPEAMELLNNCLTSREMELHRKLGDAWSVSRKNWNGYVPPYIPRFYDGWNAPMDWLDDEARTMGKSDARAAEGHVQFQNTNASTSLRPPEVYGVPQRNSSSPVASIHSSVINGNDGRGGGGGESSFLRDLLSRNAQIYRALQSRKSDKKPEITIEKGEFLEVLDSSRQWWKVRNWRGETGFAPNTLLQPYSSS